MNNPFKIIMIFSLLMLFSFPSAYSADVKPAVAVMDFESVGSEEHLGKAVAEIMRTELISTGQFRVLERSQIERALSEQKFQKAGITDNDSIVEIGKFLGANFIIIGSVVKIGTSYTINSRMVDVKTGEATLGRNVTGNDLNLLANLSRTLIESLFGTDKKINVPQTVRLPPAIFEEHFKSNVHGWMLVNDEKKTFEIADGKYIIESKNGGWWYSTRRVPLNQYLDFRIDMTVQKISGTDNYGFGMIWGLRDAKNLYQFVITGSGYFIHERIADGQTDRIFSQVEGSINKGSGSKNILSLRKSGNSVEFYINNNLAGKTISSPFFGERTGCVVYSGTNKIKVSFTDIYVYGEQ